MDRLITEKLSFQEVESGILSTNLHDHGDKVGSAMVFGIQPDLEALTGMDGEYRAREVKVSTGDVEAPEALRGCQKEP